MTTTDTRVIRFVKEVNQAKLGSIVNWLDLDKELGIKRKPGKKLNIQSFSLPSGYSCPFASDCLSKADRVTGKITDGKETLYRCFAASLEAIYINSRNLRWDNFDILKHLETDEMVPLILEALPDDCDICRIHIGGDFFNQKYFDAWLEVARLRPDVLFYAYTKSLPYWVARLGTIPSNLRLNASRGSRTDYLIDKHNLKVAEVVLSPEEAAAKGLEIDHDERHAVQDTGNFALLIHGTQPKGSAAAEAKRAMDKRIKAGENIQYAYPKRTAKSLELLTTV